MRGEGISRIISGDIHYFRLPEVLQLVSLQRLTGRLSLSHEGQTVDIYVRGGDVAFATGEKRGRREQLGALLVNMGRLTQDALDRVLGKCARTGGRLGYALVEEGLVSRDDIRAALLKQTERSVYRAMAWGNGSFFFELSDMPDFIEDMPVGLRVEDLILEGVRRIDEGRLIAEKIPSLDMVFTKTIYQREELSEMNLKGDEMAVLELIDGKKDVRALMEASGLAEYGLLRALYALYSAGLVKKHVPAHRAYRTQYL